MTGLLACTWRYVGGGQGGVFEVFASPAKAVGLLEQPIALRLVIAWGA